MTLEEGHACVKQLTPVEKWGTWAIISEGWITARGIDDVERDLIARCIAKAERQGRTHVPGREHVEYLMPDDPQVMFGQHEVPEGTRLAMTTIRCVVDHPPSRPDPSV